MNSRVSFDVFYEFFKNIEQTIDWETAEKLKGELNKICAAYNQILTIIDEMRVFLTERATWDRKNLALDVISTYSKNGRSSYLFELKDKNELCRKSIKKLLCQILEN